jgi:Tfp pilus assembly protein PilF
VLNLKSRCSAVALTFAFNFWGCQRPMQQPQNAGSDRQSALWRSYLDLAENAERGRQHDIARQYYVAAAAATTEPLASAEIAKRFAGTLASWGHLEQATTQLELCVAQAPQRPDAWHDLGMLRYQTGDITGAITALQRSIALLPNDPRSRIALAALHWTTSQWALALAQYQALQQMELTDPVKKKVTWAIATLTAKLASH